MNSIVVTDTIHKLIGQFVFELNDAVTEKAISHVINAYLQSMKDINRINKFDAVCDGSNNDGFQNTITIDVAIEFNNKYEANLYTRRFRLRLVPADGYKSYDEKLEEVNDYRSRMMIEKLQMQDE